MSHNFIIFSSYSNHIFVIITAVRDEILTEIFIFFSTWLYNYYYQFNQKERAAQKALGLYEVPP